MTTQYSYYMCYSNFIHSLIMHLSFYSILVAIKIKKLHFNDLAVLRVNVCNNSNK